MNLQLYKLGNESYLVDFKNLAPGFTAISDEANPDPSPEARRSSSSSSSSNLAEKILKLEIDDSSAMEMDREFAAASRSQRFQEKYRRLSQNMEFFEMCSALITTLAQ